jgi:hypothetical protein
MVTPLSDPVTPTPIPADLQAAQILLRSELPIYSNSKLKEKLQFLQWLISATLLEFNHLRGSCRMQGGNYRRVVRTLHARLQGR